MTRHILLKFLTGLGFLLIFALGSCTTIPGPAEETTTPESSATLPPTAEPTQTTMPTALPPLIVLLSPPDADQPLSELLQGEISSLAQASGLRWQIRDTLNIEETAGSVDYVVALPPVPSLDILVQAAPNTRFLAVGFENLTPADNLIAFHGGNAPDFQGFLGGYISAMLIPGWRVGVISIENNQAGQAARVGFENGVRFFCGLCRPLYPPFYNYPLYAGLPADASQAEWRALADFMRDHLVDTVYVFPGAGGEDLLRYLASQQIRIIGGGIPPEGIEDFWAASIRTEVDKLYLEYLPKLLSGEAGLLEKLPLLITDTNDNLFSPGKQRLANEILMDLQAGLIATGYDGIP